METGTMPWNSVNCHHGNQKTSSETIAVIRWEMRWLGPKRQPWRWREAIGDLRLSAIPLELSQRSANYLLQRDLNLCLEKDPLPSLSFVGQFPLALGNPTDFSYLLQSLFHHNLIIFIQYCPCWNRYVVSISWPGPGCYRPPWVEPSKKPTDIGSVEFVESQPQHYRTELRRLGLWPKSSSLITINNNHFQL